MGAQKLIRAEFLYIEGAQKLIRAIFSTLLRTQGAQKLVRAEFSTNKVVNYIGICMVKWLFARNDVIIEKAMSHILRTTQVFDLQVFLFTFKSRLLSKYHAPKNNFAISVPL